jgi:2,4-dienoyl-CoA reductase-like NADH-dependent reductase (Old Yellow Enzyme family)
MTKYPHVFKPLKIGNMTIKNRMQFTLVVSCLSTADGEVTEEMIEWIGFQARTDAGYITIGDTQIDLERARCFYGELNVTHDKYMTGLTFLVEEAQTDTYDIINLQDCWLSNRYNHLQKYFLQSS